MVFQEHRTPRHADGPATLTTSKRPGHPLTRPGHGLVGDPYLIQCRPTRPRHVRPDAGVYRASTTRPQGHDNACQERHIDSTQSLPHSRRSSTRCRTPRSPTARTIINFRKIDRSLRLPSASSVITLWCTHLVALKEVDQDRLSLPQVIDPDIRVDEDSHACSRLRGAASAT